MSADPILRLAKLRIIKLSADLEVQIASVKGGGPTVEMLRRLQDKAAESLAALAFLNIYDPKDRLKFVTLQNEVKRYDEWIADIRAIISDGKIYDKELTAQDREEMLDLLSETQEGQEQAIALGLIDRDTRD